MSADSMRFVMAGDLHPTFGVHTLHFITCSYYRRLPFLNRARARDRFLAILEQLRERFPFVVVRRKSLPTQTSRC
jgi:REP element-mobilizing transposase RayT